MHSCITLIIIRSLPLKDNWRVLLKCKYCILYSWRVFPGLKKGAALKSFQCVPPLLGGWRRHCCYWYADTHIFKAALDILSDMINAAYYDNTLIFIGDTLREKPVFHHQAMFKHGFTIMQFNTTEHFSFSKAKLYIPSSLTWSWQAINKGKFRKKEKNSEFFSRKLTWKYIRIVNWNALIPNLCLDLP